MNSVKKSPSVCEVYYQDKLNLKQALPSESYIVGHCLDHRTWSRGKLQDLSAVNITPFSSPEPPSLLVTWSEKRSALVAAITGCP